VRDRRSGIEERQEEGCRRREAGGEGQEIDRRGQEERKRSSTTKTIIKK
jgi:hypothetical protein